MIDAATARPLHIVFGGSFDPVHLGHEAMVDAAMSQLKVDEMRILPCRIPPHKSALHASDGDRLAMLKLVFQGRANLCIDTFELARNDTSYTIHTLRALREKVGQACSLCFLMGGDSWSNFTSWYQWQDILELVNILLVSRPGHASVEARSEMKSEVGTTLDQYRKNNEIRFEEINRHKCGKIAALPMLECPISSTELRRRFTESGNANADAFLNPNVAHYIQQHALYQSQRSER